MSRQVWFRTNQAAFRERNYYSRRQVRPPFAACSKANLPPISCRIEKLLVRLIRGKSCRRQPQMGQDFPRGVLEPVRF